MYAPKIFREEQTSVLLSTIAAIGAVSLVTTTDEGLVSTFAPVLVDGDDDNPVLVGHISRSNPQWRTADTSQPALAIAVGANGYVSPNWYPSKHDDPRVVPTWNYLQVQARGRIEFLESRVDCLKIVGALTDLHESHMDNGWSVDDAPPDFIDSKLTGIVGFYLHVDGLEGSSKLSQNQTEPDRSGVLDALSSDPSAASQSLARAMQHRD